MPDKMTKRQQAALETRKKIVDAARAIIAEKGFDSVSVHDIVQAAGVSQGSFYTYFRRKEDVIEELNQSDFYRLAEIINQRANDTLMEKLQAYCQTFLHTIEQTGMEICRQWIRNNIAPSPMCFASETMTKYEYDVRAMESILDQAVRQGQLNLESPVHELALLINSQLYGLMVAWCMSDGQVMGSDEVASYCELFLSKALTPYMC